MVDKCFIAFIILKNAEYGIEAEKNFTLKSSNISNKAAADLNIPFLFNMLSFIISFGGDFGTAERKIS